MSDTTPDHPPVDDAHQTPPAAPPLPPAYSAPPAPDTYPAPAAPPYGAPPPGYPGAPAAHQPYGAPHQPNGAPAPQPYGAPQQQYGASQPYGAAPAYSGAYAGPKTNVLAIISMIASIVGFVWILPFIGSLAGVIMGHISLRQLSTSGEKGRGMALAGLIVGYVGLAFFVIGIGFFIFFAALAASDGYRYSS